LFVSLCYLFLVLLNGLANSHLFLSLYYLFLFLFEHRLRPSFPSMPLRHGIWFGLSEFGCQHALLCSQACSVLQTFGLDFISHAEGNDAGDDGGSEIDLGARASDSPRGD
jgi:hypothetical protein